jgi:hypothetical protein
LTHRRTSRNGDAKLVLRRNLCSLFSLQYLHSNEKKEVSDRVVTCLCERHGSPYLASLLATRLNPSHICVHVKFQAFAMVHCIKIIFFWVIIRHLVEITKPTFQDLLFVPSSGLTLKKPCNYPKEGNFNLCTFL